MGEKVESFDDAEVLEVPSTNATQTEGGEGLDTFDNPTEVEATSEEKEEKVEVKEDKIDKDSQVNLLKDQDDKDVESKSEEKDEKKEGDKDSDDKEEKEEDEGKEKEQEKNSETETEGKPEKRKEVKGKVGEDEFGIPVEAEVAVRIKGKKEKVTVQELMNNYSGKKNWDQEYSKLGEEKKEVTQKATQLEGEVDFLKGHINKIVGILEDDKSNPMDALEYLLDTTGRDTVSFKKKVMETMLEEVESLQDMDDVERDLYWKNQELSDLKRRQESSMATSRQELEQNQLREKVDMLREAQDVSEDSFVDAHEELDRLGYENITPEEVVNWAALKPHMETSEEIVLEYKDSISPEGINNLITDIAVDLKKGVITKKEAKAMLEEEFGDSKELESLTKRSSKGAKKVVTNSAKKYKDMGEDHIESFDDYDLNYVS